MKPLAYPPRITDFTRPHFAALQEGRLLTTRCASCTELTFPPKFLCPDCWGQDVEWVELSGWGTLRSATRVHAGPAAFSAELPYTLGIVDLDEGVRCLARIDTSTQPRCDERVRLAIRPAEPAPMLCFHVVEAVDSSQDIGAKGGQR